MIKLSEAFYVLPESVLAKKSIDYLGLHDDR